ncbi:GTPase IMAP family member 8-like [Hoplias malabaricus]|uniref:GTPase IMAP family member 8-like n=1 Tax=Hoplias malabaricus TaxID=27720 RepID=UPI0034631B45
MASSEVSELRIILLGKDRTEISNVGNFILDRAALDPEAPPPSVGQHTETVRGHVEGRYITLTSAPHLFHHQLSEEEVSEKVIDCVSLCAPGPHIIAVVLKPDNFTVTDGTRLDHIHDSLPEKSYKYTLVLKVQNVESSSRAREAEIVSPEIITKYTYKHVELNSECSCTDLVEIMEKMVAENGGGYLQWKKSHNTQLKLQGKRTARKMSEETVPEKNTKENLFQRLNFIVCGSDATLKSSISDLILGQKESSPQSSSVCVRKEGEVCGRLISLVELPALYNTQSSEEDVIQEILRCVYLFDRGVHAFLLIVPEGPLSDEDKEVIKKTQMIFGSQFNKHTIFIINKDTQQESLEINEATKDIIETYKGQVCVLDESRNSVLLEQAEEMVMNNSGNCYTTAMFLHAQVTQLLQYKSDIEEMKKNNLQDKNKHLIQGGLRIVLLGKTGVLQETPFWGKRFSLSYFHLNL